MNDFILFIGGAFFSINVILLIFSFIRKIKEAKLLEDESNDKSNDTLVAYEENQEQHEEFHNTIKEVLQYALTKEIKIVIQPNYEGVMCIFHNDINIMYQITEFVVGNTQQMIRKIDNYITHKEQIQKEMKENVTQN